VSLEYLLVLLFVSGFVVKSVFHPFYNGDGCIHVVFNLMLCRGKHQFTMCLRRNYTRMMEWVSMKKFWLFVIKNNTRNCKGFLVTNQSIDYFLLLITCVVDILRWILY